MSPEIVAAVERISKLPRSRPPVIVFSNRAYAPILANWLVHAKAAGAENIVVVALDRQTAAGISPDDALCISLLPIASRGELWLRRTELLAGLVGAGIDFVHSDADAVWLRSPVDEIFCLGTDLIFSTGTIWPPDVVASWGFVLCCGLFGVRAGRATADLFAEMLDRVRLVQDDQIAVNRLLAEKGTIWNAEGPSESRQWKGREFRIFDRPITGRCNGLSISLLPHRRFPRLPEIATDTVVAHPLSSQSAGDTIRELRRLGLWRPPQESRALWLFRRPLPA